MAHARNGESDHHPEYTSCQRSKIEQLARTRRNQQRCRERKRAHVSELESQVQTLQEKIRQCEPCGTQTTAEEESQLDRIARENAARRDLLLALGFDDEAQERFIGSEAKRQTVLLVLQGSDEHANVSQMRGSGHDGESLRAPSTAPSGAVTSHHVLPVQPSNLDAGPQAFDIGQQIDSFDPDNWLFYPGTQDHLQSYLSDLPGDDSWLSQPFSKSAIYPNAQLPNTVTGPSPAPATSSTQQRDDDQCCERCFQDTVVEVPPSENLMVCSTALSMIFRHNRKGLSLAELQKRLRPGMRPPSEGSKECRIEESVLFRVLADIAG